jgi:hypothetical protein
MHERCRTVENEDYVEKLADLYRRLLSDTQAQNADSPDPVFVAGECVYDTPAIDDIKTYCLAEVDALWDEVKRFENPHRYYVDLSPALWDMKQRMLKKEGQF